MRTGTVGVRRSWQRHGPFWVIAPLVIVALTFAGCTSGDDDDDVATGTTEPGESENGTDSDLPIIYQEAQEAGTEADIEWGEGCDTETGRLKIPVRNAAPCIEPWDETADNGGATAPQGVTADEIVVALYKGQPDPLQQAIIEGAGADTDPNAINQQFINYAEMFEDVYETYGRTLRIETIEATGGPADSTAALADAQKVLELKPFAAINGPAQTPAYWQELTNAGIICVGACSLAETWDTVEAQSPYLWPTGPSPDQADAHLAEMVGKQLAGKPAEFGGDDVNGKDRVFGFVQAETEAGEYQARNDAFIKRLKDDYDVDVAAAARSTYIYDPANAQQIATSTIARMKDAGVTTIMLSIDPIIPADITKEATKQNYFPEWALGPSVLADTTIFGRRFDQVQWEHMVGISLPTARAPRETVDSYVSHEWYFGEPPLVNSQAVIYPGPFRLLTGIHLAGPNLTPETFEAGLFRFPPEEPGLTYAYDSWGDELWGRDDYNSSDDAAAIWWDAAATGQDEAGNEGVGMLRYVDGGQRHLPGEWPTEPIPWFEVEGSVTVYDERPDGAPDYPAWPGSPAAG